MKRRRGGLLFFLFRFLNLHKSYNKGQGNRRMNRDEGQATENWARRRKKTPGHRRKKMQEDMAFYGRFLSFDDAPSVNLPKTDLFSVSLPALVFSVLFPSALFARFVSLIRLLLYSHAFICRESSSSVKGTKGKLEEDYFSSPPVFICRKGWCFSALKDDNFCETGSEGKDPKKQCFLYLVPSQWR